CVFRATETAFTCLLWHLLTADSDSLPFFTMEQNFVNPDFHTASKKSPACASASVWETDGNRNSNHARVFSKK
ncbi:MAG: hypothetical protein LBG96_01225, partial [Tannerella sp.]|nr:hypothetical protein [Tannerella sp.]